MLTLAVRPILYEWSERSTRPRLFRRACRHGDRCSRIHNKPTISQTILLQNMYQNPAMSMPPGPDGLPPAVDPRVSQEHFEVRRSCATPQDNNAPSLPLTRFTQRCATCTAAWPEACQFHVTEFTIRGCTLFLGRLPAAAATVHGHTPCPTRARSRAGAARAITGRM